MRFNTKDERLIVALDVPTQERATKLVRALKDHAGYFKVGLQLFTAAGPAVIRKILQEETKVFLDLKLHDIPNTAAQAAVEAARLGVHMMTLHTLGGEAMMRQTRETLQESSQREGWPIPKLLGVTILTSMDQTTLSSVGIEHPIDAEVLRLAKSAQRAALDGIVSSPHELGLFRQVGLHGLLFVTPGIRSSTSAGDDQVRTMTASQALAEGADYLIVGRPIIRAPDPVRAARAILEEIHLGSSRNCKS
ncbi:orotidine-5'-phosphate decarboxylase [Acidobacteria bacterium AH-259-G07]|nr:orotidine-5'-phosphate decarboxylase [Acidobacteria bacterium AH-259-G07]